LCTEQGKTIGIFGIGYAIEDLVSSNRAWQERILHEIFLLGGHSVESIFKKIMFDKKQSQLGLSTRQMQCLELLAKGMTYKQIASFLSLSIRTIQHYIEAIKIKWDCDCRYTLIEKFLNS
jgi:DNA-binding NarL/FixJ family response regulator